MVKQGTDQEGETSKCYSFVTHGCLGRTQHTMQGHSDEGWGHLVDIRRGDLRTGAFCAISVGRKG